MIQQKRISVYCTSFFPTKVYRKAKICILSLTIKGYKKYQISYSPLSQITNSLKDIKSNWSKNVIFQYIQPFLTKVI